MDPSQNESDYLKMINYLITQLNKAKSANIPNQLHNKPIFLYEFFVFSLYLPRELLRLIKHPVLAFRLFDFPTLTIQGNAIFKDERILFNQGKSSYFEMELEEIKESLLEQPMYIMFIDMNFGDMKIIGSSRLNISIFSYDSFLQFSGSTPKPRKNILKLFDNSLEKVAEFEMSLLIRREYYKYEVNSFPLNQEKIFVNNNNINFNKNNNKTYAKNFSNELRMQNTENILKSDHIKMDMNEKTQKQFLGNIKKDKINDENEDKNKIEVYYNKNYDYEDIKNTKNFNNTTKGIASQTVNDYNINNYKPDNFDEPNTHPDDVFKGEENVMTIQDMLNANDKNPPPMFYTHQIPKKEEKVIRIIHEESKDNRNNNITKKEISTQTENYFNKNNINVNRNKNTIKNKKLTKDDIVNLLYNQAIYKYNNAMRTNNYTINGNPPPIQFTNENTNKNSTNKNSNNSSNNNIENNNKKNFINISPKDNSSNISKKRYDNVNAAISIEENIKDSNVKENSKNNFDNNNNNINENEISENIEISKSNNNKKSAENNKKSNNKNSINNNNSKEISESIYDEFKDNEYIKVVNQIKNNNNNNDKLINKENEVKISDYKNSQSNTNKISEEYNDFEDVNENFGYSSSKNNNNMISINKNNNDLNNENNNNVNKNINTESVENIVNTNSNENINNNNKFNNINVENSNNNIKYSNTISSGKNKKSNLQSIQSDNTSSLERSLLNSKEKSNNNKRKLSNTSEIEEKIEYNK